MSNHPEAAISAGIKVSQLRFDSENPRFPKEIANGPPDQLLERFIRDERLQEIVDSIANHGFFPGEPLLVIDLNKDAAPDEKIYKVVEGNRRLAALKLLTKELPPPEGRSSIENSVESAKYRPATVPCLIFDDDKEILRYLGFRHITGIKAWGALQKARYLQRLYVAYSKLPIEEGLKALAKEIGSRADYVGQMLTSLAMYDDAERESFYGLDLSAQDIEFSVLTTALSYSNIVDFLGLDSRRDIHAVNLNKANSKDLFDWLFVSRNGQKPIVNESRELRRLAAIVVSPDAIRELKNSRELNASFELSKGPEVALNDALRLVSSKLRSTLNLVSKTKIYDDSHREFSDQILKAAKSINLLISSGFEEQELEKLKNKNKGG
ncbi:ParB N-terminal domain-containing protein [Comamonas jiangduensis]